MIDQEIFNTIKKKYPNLSVDVIRNGHALGIKYYTASLNGLLIDDFSDDFMAYSAYIIDFQYKLYDNCLITEDELLGNPHAISLIRDLSF
jgi:hypothetical protein